jgi:ribonuclease-3 family protein
MLKRRCQEGKAAGRRIHRKNTVKTRLQKCLGRVILFRERGVFVALRAFCEAGVLLRDYLNPIMDDREILGVPALGLAYIGDAVFELMVRSWLCAEKRVTAREMHAAAIRRVSARAQASSSRLLPPVLTERETDVFKRGRNARIRSVPRGSTPAEYHAATGLEALFGYLYLKGESARLGELFGIIVSGEGTRESELT